ncbi:hypothetical protein [Priestia aryabhattai]|uniref:hypothetical protein n=1 Tax=Priestia aryabhattai TaxID=412384 RepID=UPI0008DCC341|nr:hypothetical protein [Priestia aryabhattai]OHY73343.1 hypothetical protein BCV52_26900 [Priestia aryabhattai]
MKLKLVSKLLIVGLLATSFSAIKAEAATPPGQAKLSVGERKAVSKTINIKNNMKVTGHNSGGYNMTAWGAETVLGYPDPIYGSMTVKPKSTVTKYVSNIGQSSFYALAKPTYINQKNGEGYTSGTSTVSGY